MDVYNCLRRRLRTSRYRGMSVPRSQDRQALFSFGRLGSTIPSGFEKMAATAVSNAITLKGSTEMVAEFFGTYHDLFAISYLRNEVVFSYT